MSAIGIDFGTTNSVLAQFTNGEATTAPIDTPKSAEWAELGFDRVLPSVFARGPSDEPLFGWAAKLRPGRKLEAVKRLLAADDKVSFDGREYLVEEMASMLFGAIKQGAAASGIDVKNAVVTVPANSRGLARLRTRICAGLVGIEVPVLINEPTAAAMAYGLRTTTDQNVLVVDWGGGTLDVTLLMIADGIFVEQASKGVSRLGGVDIDRLIMKQLSEDIPEASTWTDEEVATAMLELELTKIRLSEHEETSVQLPRGQRRTITRRRLNEWIAPLIERLLVPVRTVIAEGANSGSSVDNVLLVGGSCKIPIVRDVLAEVTGCEPLRGAVDPMTAVAEGAAIASAILAGEYDADFFVTTEHALGTDVLNAKSGMSEFSPIIHRNTKIPTSAIESYIPVVDDQTSLLLRVIEGDESKPLADEENVPLAEWPVELTPRPMAQARIDIEYSYDVSGLIHVKATDGIDGRVLSERDVQELSGRDPRTLVEVAHNVGAVLDEAAASDQRSAGHELPADVRESLDRARKKVVPFVPDEEAETLKQLADALEQAAASGAGAAAKAELDDALRRYAYLF